MRLFLIVVFAFFSVFLLTGCDKKCEGKKITFGLIYGNKGDSVRIFLDSARMIAIHLSEDYKGQVESKEDRLFTACVVKDSILVQISINRRDTSFFIDPKQIKECYVGSSIYGIIHVYHNRVNGGFGIYDPKR